MTILLDRSFSDGNAYNDLWQIARCDSGMDIDSNSTAQYYQIVFAQNNSNTGSDLAQALADSGDSFVIAAAISGYQVGPINNQAIEDLGGVVAYWDGTSYQIVYDASNNSGTGYSVKDEFSTSHISHPAIVRLFRGLSWALHLSDNSIASGQSAIDDQLSIDENVFRLHLPMSTRDATDGNVFFDVGNSEQVPECPSCFVVTAALGEAQAQTAVAGLRRMRDALGTQSQLCGAFFGALMDEYRRFGPAVAAAMSNDPILARSVKDWLVTPLLRYQRIFELFAGSDYDAAQFVAAISSRRDGPFAMLDPVSLVRAGEIARAAADLASALAEAAKPAQPSRPPADATAPGPVFAYIAAAIAAGGGPTTHIAWAVRALSLYWSAAAAIRGTGGHLAPLIETWLDEVPVPAALITMPADALARELAQLSDLVFRSARLRAALAARLRRLGPALGRTDMEFVLAAAGLGADDRPA
jgi:hypothetical protein